MDFKIMQGARCAVIGYGSWATALVKVLTERACEVGWYVRNPEVLESLLAEGRNPRYLQDVEFDRARIRPSDDLNRVVDEADVILLAAPSAFLKSFLEPLTVSLKEKFVLSAIKGIVPDDYQTIVEYLSSRYELQPSQIGIITGPSHAEEVALERLSYLTVVCPDPENARTLGEMFSTPYIKLSYSTDLYGVEYATVLKNIYALAVGVAVGLGYGDNFLAVLISNGAMEMSRFMERTYPASRDTFASAYLGDLLVTSYSQFSRNRRFGLMIGKGYSVASARAEMNMVAEGYYAAECVMKINERHGVEMPIASAVYDMLYREAPAASALASLTDKLV